MTISASVTVHCDGTVKKARPRKNGQTSCVAMIKAKNLDALAMYMNHAGWVTIGDNHYCEMHAEKAQEAI